MAPETTTGNPALLAEQVASLLVQPLEAASVVLSNGVQVFQTNTELRIPRLTAGATAGFVAEGAVIPEGDVAFDEVRLLPSTLKSLKVIVTVTNELVRQSVVGIDDVLKTRLVTDVANALDTALLTGAGTSNTIKGIINQTGVTTGVLDPADPDSILDGIAAARADNVEPNRIFMSGADFATMSKLKEGTASKRYLLEANIHAGPTYSFAGIPLVVTNKLPVGKTVIADTSQIAVAQDVAPSVAIDTGGSYFASDLTAFRVVARYDLGLLHPEGVVVLTDAP